jgi:hypothetical protein
MFSGDVSTPASILRESYQENKDKAKKADFQCIWLLWAILETATALQSPD